MTTKNTKKWQRVSFLNCTSASPCRETWECVENGKKVAEFPVTVTFGKPLDVFSLKGDSLEHISSYAQFLQNAADQVYFNEAELREILFCPCCAEDTKQSSVAFLVHGVPYHRCLSYNHLFVRKQPTEKSLEKIFADSKGYSETYVDPKSLKARLEQVVKPKLEWLSCRYAEFYGQRIESILDVGAGGGHFVAFAKMAGLRAEGFELSKVSRFFAKKNFKICLRDQSFLLESPARKKFSAVTFWGLLEYVPEPEKFLQRAHLWLKEDLGMLIVEVPRVDCLGTIIQTECPSVIARHLDPTTHLNCFSDASLLTLLYRSGWKPVGAWYFGMDMYEFVMQVALRIKAEDVLDRIKCFISPLQKCLDSGHLGDDIIVAAVPRQNVMS